VTTGPPPSTAHRGLAIAALATAVLACAPLIASPLGDFAPPLALLLVLPPIAVALGALGWGRRAGDHLRARVRARNRPSALFLVWSGVSAHARRHGPIGRCAVPSAARHVSVLTGR